jgi:hypothetical protein
MQALWFKSVTWTSQANSSRYQTLQKVFPTGASLEETNSIGNFASGSDTVSSSINSLWHMPNCSVYTKNGLNIYLIQIFFIFGEKY